MLNQIIAKLFPKTYYIDKSFGRLCKRGEGCPHCERLKEEVGYCNNCPIHGIVASYNPKTGISSRRHWEEGIGWVLDAGNNAFSYGTSDDNKLD